MPNFTGNLKGKTVAMTCVALNDTPEHQLMLQHSVATQRCSDTLFDSVKCTSWSTADLIRGDGQERGHFMNEHANGDRDGGTYECKVSTVNGQITMEGTWKYTHGTGQFNGLTGNGTFKGRIISPTETEISFEGSYQLKAGTRAA